MDTRTPNRAENTLAVALDPTKLPNAVRAVAYVRMSTDQQELSIGTQLETISRYAEGNQMRLVRVYEDAAKSGLQIGNRSAMKQLLRDVMDDQIQRDVAEQVRLGGLDCKVHPRSRLMIVGGTTRVRLQFVWPRVIDGATHWHTFKRDIPASDFVLLALMDDGPVVNEFQLQEVGLYKQRPKWIRTLPAENVTVIRDADRLVAAIRDAHLAKLLSARVE